jgi:hypothetical protein
MLYVCIIVVLEEFSYVNACQYIYIWNTRSKNNDLALDFLEEMNHFRNHYQSGRN